MIAKIESEITKIKADVLYMEHALRLVKERPKFYDLEGLLRDLQQARLRTMEVCLMAADGCWP